MLCERYGVDSLYVEMLGSWLMTLYKNGIITAADTDGIPMVKGSEEAITALITNWPKPRLWEAVDRWHCTAAKSWAGTLWITPTKLGMPHLI